MERRYGGKTYDANSANGFWKMEYRFVDCTHYISYFPIGVFDVSV